MDAKIVYWGGAVLNFAVLTGFALVGVQQIKRGERERHRRSMLVAASLVLVFLVSYVLKLVFLGREDRALWSSFDVWTLRFHELCVLSMLISGLGALVLGGRLKKTKLFASGSDAPAPARDDLKRHRLAGRIAMFGAVLGLLSAAVVWFGMWGRAA